MAFIIKGYKRTTKKKTKKDKFVKIYILFKFFFSSD